MTTVNEWFRYKILAFALLPVIAIAACEKFSRLTSTDRCLSEYFDTIAPIDDDLLYVYDNRTANALNLFDLRSKIGALNIWNVDVPMATVANPIRFKAKRYLLHGSTAASIANLIDKLTNNNIYWHKASNPHFTTVIVYVDDLHANCRWISLLWKARLVRTIVFQSINAGNRTRCATYIYDPFQMLKDCEDEWRNVSAAFGENEAKSTCVLDNDDCQLDNADCIRTDSDCLSPPIDIDARIESFVHLNDMKSRPIGIAVDLSHFVPPYIIKRATTPHAEGLLMNPINLWLAKFNLHANYFYNTRRTSNGLNRSALSAVAAQAFAIGFLDVGAPYPFAPISYSPSIAITRSLLREERYWLVPKPDRISNWRSILRIYASDTWCFLLVVYVTVTCIWRISNRSMSDGERGNRSDSCGYFLATFRVVLGIAIRVERRAAIRVLIVVYVLFAFNVNYIFQGIYSSILTVPQHERPIASARDLLRSRLRLMIKKVLVEELVVRDPLTMAAIARKSLLFDEKLTDLPNLIGLHRNRAITTFKYSLEVTEAHKKYVIDTFPDSLMRPLSIGYALRDDSPYLESLNRVVDVVNEAGLVAKWRVDYRKCVFLTDYGDERDFIVLRWEHVRFAFVVWAIGLAVAAVAFVYEWISYSWLSRRINGRSERVAIWFAA